METKHKSNSFSVYPIFLLPQKLQILYFLLPDLQVVRSEQLTPSFWGFRRFRKVWVFQLDLPGAFHNTHPRRNKVDCSLTRKFWTSTSTTASYQEVAQKYRNSSWIISSPPQLPLTHTLTIPQTPRHHLKPLCGCDVEDIRILWGFTYMLWELPRNISQLKKV